MGVLLVRGIIVIATIHFPWNFRWLTEPKLEF